MMENRNRSFGIFLVLVIGLVLVLQAVINKLSDSPVQEPAPTSVQEPIPTSVLSASMEQQQMIQEGLDEGLSLGRAFCVKSRSHQNAYYVAAELIGLDNSVGTWIISGSPSSPSGIQSVDAFARAYSVYPDARNTAVGAQPTDPEVGEVKRAFR